MADLFSAAGDLFAGLAEAKGYQQAASYEKQNAMIEREARDVNLLRQARAAYKSFGATRAGYAGGGIRSDAGTALSALAEAHSNAALDKALIGMQGQIAINADLAKASEYSAEATAKAGGGIFSFLGKVIGSFI
jgi:hypothetical protein